MSNLNKIGLDKKASKALAKSLNDLLANYSVFYQNARAFHWNVRGKKFFELHIKFEELYNDLFAKIDEIAERILTLGESPLHSYSQYYKLSEVKEVKDTKDGEKAIENILDTFQILITKQRAVLNQAGEIDDEGTNSLMSDYIREQEKLVWMYSAFLDKKL